MEPIVGLEDWFVDDGSRANSTSGLDEFFPATQAEGATPEAVEGYEEITPITSEDMRAAVADAVNAESDAQKAEWFDAWAMPVAVSSAAIMDDLQRISDMLAEAQQASSEDSELISALRETIKWQEKMSGPTPPFPSPAEKAVAHCIVCSEDAEFGIWDSKTGASVCRACADLVKLGKNLQSFSGTSATTTYPYGVTWSNSAFSITQEASGFSANASWTGVAGLPPVSEPVEVTPADPAAVVSIVTEAVLEAAAPPVTESAEELAPDAKAAADDPEDPAPLAPERVVEVVGEARMPVPERFRDMLRESDAENLGYQLVSILMADGVLYEGVVVIDCEEAIMPDNVNPENIEVIEITNPK